MGVRTAAFVVAIGLLGCESDGQSGRSSTSSATGSPQKGNSARSSTGRAQKDEASDSQADRPTLAQRLREAELVDLTHEIHADIPVFPGTPRFSSNQVATIDEDGYFANEFTMGEHVGTHVDAPAHFIKDQSTIEEVKVHELVAEAAVIDVRETVADNSDYLVPRSAIREWEQRHEKLGTQHLVLVRTGWAKRWPNEARFRNTDDAEVMHYPGVSPEAAELLKKRGVRGIGIDTLSTDRGTSTEFPEHKRFLAGGGYHIENLARLDALPESGAVVFVGVLPLHDGSGAPARVVAWVPPQ